jgi:hypothetical protein
MGLFDRTAKHLAAGPTLVLPADRVDEVTELVRRYDPGLLVKSDRFYFDNGVFLYGPVDTPVNGMVAYYARPAALPKREERPEDAKLLDGERLVRGLAVRVGGDKQGERPWAELDLEVSVFAEQPIPAEQVISVLRPFAGTEDGQELAVDEQREDDSYILISEREPVFLTVFWPGYLSRSRKAAPPLALGPMRKAEPCRWQLRTTARAATAVPALCRLVAEAGLALAAATNGVVVDMFGFPITTPDELLPA